MFEIYINEFILFGLLLLYPITIKVHLTTSSILSKCERLLFLRIWEMLEEVGIDQVEFNPHSDLIVEILDWFDLLLDIRSIVPEKTAIDLVKIEDLLVDVFFKEGGKLVQSLDEDTICYIFPFVRTEHSISTVNDTEFKLESKNTLSVKHNDFFMNTPSFGNKKVFCYGLVVDTAV